MELYAWIGEDELGSGVTGLKQGAVPAGYIALVAMGHHLDRLERVAPQMEMQAAKYGKRIYLVRFVFAGVVAETAAGTPNAEVAKLADAQP